VDGRTRGSVAGRSDPLPVCGALLPACASSPKEAEHDIDWGGIMLIVAGLSPGTAVFDSARRRRPVPLGPQPVPQLLRPFVIVLGAASCA
jgi:hypothetical protein